MSGFEFVSHESYPEDQYIAESAILCFDGKFRVTYVRKKMQTGGMFWSEISAAVSKGGEKKYLKSFSQDSNFLQDDIKSFLEGRRWEIGRSANVGGTVSTSASDVQEEFPF